jgi:hypothetical protein
MWDEYAVSVGVQEAYLVLVIKLKGETALNTYAHINRDYRNLSQGRMEGECGSDFTAPGLCAVTVVCGSTFELPSSV